MEKVFLGTIVNTHGIKGEMRIKSNFPYKDKAFLVGSELIIDSNKYKITSYRIHKNYCMITLEGFTNINQVLQFKNKKVYKDKNQLELSQEEYLDDDLLDCIVLAKTTNSLILTGQVVEVVYASPTNKLLRVKFQEKEMLIPINPVFISRISLDEKKIIVNLIDGM